MSLDDQQNLEEDQDFLPSEWLNEAFLQSANWTALPSPRVIPNPDNSPKEPLRIFTQNLDDRAVKAPISAVSSASSTFSNDIFQSKSNQFDVMGQGSVAQLFPSGLLQDQNLFYENMPLSQCFSLPSSSSIIPQISSSATALNNPHLVMNTQATQLHLPQRVMLAPPPSPPSSSEFGDGKLNATTYMPSSDQPPASPLVTLNSSPLVTQSNSKNKKRKSAATATNESGDRPLTPSEKKRIRELSRNLTCFNCQTTKTPLWRRTPDKQHNLCNACGLYYKQYKTHRNTAKGSDEMAVTRKVPITPDNSGSKEEDEEVITLNWSQLQNLIHAARGSS